MLVIREVFQLHYGQAREAIDLMKQAQSILKQDSFNINRILTDVTGNHYSLVIESEFKDLSTFEQGLQDVYDNKEWQEIYKQFKACVQSGHREILRAH